MPKTLLQNCLDRATHEVMYENLDAIQDEDATTKELAQTLWLTLRLSHNVAMLIIEWAVVLEELQAHELGTERFAEHSHESRRTVYRRLDDFRRLYPKHDTPTALARLVLAEARRQHLRPNPSLKVALPA